MPEQALLKRRVVEGQLAGPHLLVTAGVHGDEYEPMAAVRRLAEAVSPAELRGKLTLVPVVNELAFERSSRTGEDGLDLARTCPGRADGSLTERVAFELSELIRGADYYIDLHTGGTVLEFVPLVGYSLHPDPQVLDAQRRMARAFGLNLIWGTTAELEGRTLSVARDARVPAIYAEWRGGPYDPAGVEALADGCLGVMSELGMIDRRSRATVPSPVERPLIIEDPRPASGHMQVCHPASEAGFFEPAVNLCQKVAKGEVLGHICDVLGSRQSPQHACQSGMVIGLRATSRVERDTALAVIVELEYAKELSPHDR